MIVVDVAQPRLYEWWSICSCSSNSNSIAVIVVVVLVMVVAVNFARLLLANWKGKKRRMG